MHVLESRQEDEKRQTTHSTREKTPPSKCARNRRVVPSPSEDLLANSRTRRMARGVKKLRILHIVACATWQDPDSLTLTPGSFRWGKFRWQWSIPVCEQPSSKTRNGRVQGCFNTTHRQACADEGSDARKRIGWATRIEQMLLFD